MTVMTMRQIWALYLTGDCNLSCAYCYYRPESPQGTMSAETAARSLDFIAAHAASRGARSTDIGFFGREPLTRFDLIESVAADAKRKIPAVTFSLNTNGTLLDPARLDFFRGLGARISLSLDGPPDHHDTVRPTKNGGPSYGLVEPMICGLAAYEPAVYVRMTVTAASARHFFDNATYIADLGFKKLGFAFDLTDPHWDQPAFSAARRELERFADWYSAGVAAGRGLAVPAFDSLARGRHVPDAGLFCGAASHLFAVDCDGKIYPCWRFVGSAADAIGDVVTGWKAPPDSHAFNSVRQSLAPDCAGCPHAGYCGRCAWASIRHTGSHERVSRVQCETARAAIDAGIRACESMAASQSPNFIARLSSMDAEQTLDGSLMLSDESGCVYSLPPEELERYRVSHP
ncbi:MAG: radical SAM protein [Deltaproteobacteria bacterium]|nr:radical SAM protein [Deltaproteobacteria bacterium]